MSGLEWVSAVLLAAGGFFCVAGAIGMLRMPDFYTRTHAASVIETLGAGLILAGLAIDAGFTLATAKLGAMALLIFFASPTATHALAKAAYERGIRARLARPGAEAEAVREKGPAP
jgi:multicomponent Na+:H+ antiporter subunit G